MIPSPKFLKDEPGSGEQPDHSPYGEGHAYAEDSLRWIEFDQDPTPAREGGVLGYIVAIILLFGLVYYIIQY